MSLEFEAIILNKICNSSEYFSKAIPILEKSHFESIGNQQIFKIVKEYYKEYRENPGLTEIIAMVQKVESAEMRETIKQCLIQVNSVTESKNTDFLVKQTLDFCKDAMYLESLRIGSEGLMKCDEELKSKAKKIMDDMSKLTINEGLGLDFDDLQTMIKYYQERNIGILTQHKELNKRLGTGFIPGTISLIMAASGIGKSLLMTDLISGLIKKCKNTLLVSLEMGNKEIMKRVHANALDLPINSLIDLSKTEEEKALFKHENPGHEFVTRELIEERYAELKSKGETGRLFIEEFPSGSFSALQLESLVERYKLEQGIEFDAVFVDYVGIAKSDLVTPSVGLYSYVKSIVEEFRASARKLNLPIISANQLNRGAVNNKEASNDSVSDSMGSVMTADFILFLLQDEEMKEKNQIVCKVTKNRFNGRTDNWMMNIDYKHMRFIDAVLEEDVATYVGNEKADITTMDFGIVSKSEVKKAGEFANDEVKDIEGEAWSNADHVPGEKSNDIPEIDQLLADMAL